MPRRDTNKEITKKNQMKSDIITRSKKRNEPNEPNDPPNDSSSDDEELNSIEYKKFLGKLFPSKYMTEKIKDEQKFASNSSVNKFKKNKSYDNNMADDKPNKFNIIFTIKDNESDEEDEDEYEEFDSEDEDYKTEDEDEEVSTSEDEDDTDSESEEEEEEVVQKGRRGATKQEDKTKKNTSSREGDKKENVDVVKEIINKIKNMENAGISDDKVKNEDVISQLDNIKKKYNNKLISKCISQCKKELIKQNEKIERKGEKQKERNERIFRKIIKNKNMLNDFQYFAKLDVVQQKSIIKKIREINQYEKFDKPYRLSLIESDIPAVYKVAAMKKMAILRNMDPSNGEYYKIKNWVDTFMRIPFGKVDTLPIHFSDGVEKCHEFMENAQKTLDAAVYGLNDTKMQIMQILGQLITNPSSIGTAIAIHGPPGSGKTSLVKEGISKILNRPFAFIALGGATDSSFLEGHSYTYEGSVWGKIVQILIESKSMNPVIYFDELDKISDTPKGEEIASILTHLTDTTQNSQFHDKYFSEIDFDLSKCIFIFSYNDESKVNPILKDRMYRIKTKGYDLKQKTIISNQYLLPNIRKQVVFEEGQVIIQDDALHHIIENHCCNEDGVRNLKRCMEIIYTKLNLYRLMKPGENLFETDLALKVTFPFQVTKEIVDKLIKREEGNMTYRNLYV